MDAVEGVDHVIVLAKRPIACALVQIGTMIIGKHYRYKRIVKRPTMDFPGDDRIATRRPCVTA